MSGANGLRGEVALLLGERELRLRPSFARLVAAEAEAGSLLLLIERASAGDVRLADVEAMLWHCLDGDQPIERPSLRDMLVATGLSALLPCYRALLTAAMGGV